MARIVLVLVGVLLATALVSAMVPRSRRATEEESTPSGPRICNAQTVCSWTVYDQNTRRMIYNITNDYCVCAENHQCVFYEDDISIGAYVDRCQLPPSPTTTTTTTTEASSS